MRRPLRQLAVALATLTAASLCAGQPQRAPARGKTEEKVTIERLPDGRIRKTVTHTTTRTVEPKPPPPRPADPYPSDPLVRYNVERLNAFRAKKGLAPLRYDAKISAFARAGSEQLSRDHTAHAHFAEAMKASPPPPGFGTRSAENQGDSRGVDPMDTDATKSGKKQIDLMLKMMMDEGPGGGHHDTILNPRLRRVGIGLVYAGGKLYMTNDFSD